MGRYDLLPDVHERTPASTSRLVAASAVFLLLAVLSPLTIVEWSANASSLPNLALGTAVLLFASWRLTRALTVGRDELLRGFLYVFVYINFGVAALTQAVSGRFPLDNRTYDDLTITHGYAIVVAGIAGISAPAARRRAARDGRDAGRCRSRRHGPW